jgi:hypothetical protein
VSPGRGKTKDYKIGICCQNIAKKIKLLGLEKIVIVFD